MSIFKQIKRVRDNRTSYSVGLLQAKAYRALKQTTGMILDEHGISTVEWAFLGLLYERSMSPTVAAHELGVEAPFVTSLVGKLKEKGFMLEERDEKDARRKSLRLSEAGRKFVADTEVVLRSRMRPLVKGASTRDLLGYLTVLESIIENVPSNKYLGKDSDKDSKGYYHY